MTLKDAHKYGLLLLSTLTPTGGRFCPQILSSDGLGVRLGGNATAKEGRVEILFRGQWVALTAQRWSVSSTSVICRELGHYGVNLSLGYPLPQGRVDILVLTGVECRGDEVALADCPNAGFRATTRNRGGVAVSCQIRTYRQIMVVY